MGASYAADMPAPAATEAPKVCQATLSLPSYNGPIKQNPNPSCFPTPFGDVYVGGAIIGYAYNFTNPFPFSPAPLPGDRAGRIDFTNLQAFIQKPEGPVQFYIAAGAYAIPALGFVNYGTFDQTDLLFSPLPIAFAKFQINDEWSIQGGRMPTLIGSEAPFTFQNLNISRGLLFNQENIINHGVQVKYSLGPWSVSVAGTDGFYSSELSWFTGAVSYKLSDTSTIGVNGGTNLSRTDVSARSIRYQFATLLLQQNSGIFNINYTYSNGPWVVTPYIQFTNVEADPRNNIFGSASTYGGALLASYAFTDNFALAGRIEYEEQTGQRGSATTPSLLYGPGSAAFSMTVTPSFTFDRFFARVEYSRVELYNITAGLGFGRAGTRVSQDRYMVEAGITF